MRFDKFSVLNTSEQSEARAVSYRKAQILIPETLPKIIDRPASQNRLESIILLPMSEGGLMAGKRNGSEHIRHRRQSAIDPGSI